MTFTIPLWLIIILAIPAAVAIVIILVLGYIGSSIVRRKG